MKKDLESLKEKALKLQELQSKCNHDWDELKEDILKENITIPVWHGRELSERVIATREEKCLSHTCKICGLKEYQKQKTK